VLTFCFFRAGSASASALNTNQKSNKNLDHVLRDRKPRQMKKVMIAIHGKNDFKNPENLQD
jgi:hypothetical protein